MNITFEADTHGELSGIVVSRRKSVLRRNQTVAKQIDYPKESDATAFWERLQQRLTTLTGAPLTVGETKGGLHHLDGDGYRIYDRHEWSRPTSNSYNQDGGSVKLYVALHSSMN